MATAELTVIPIGREGASAGDLIAEIQRRLEAQSQVRFQMHAMGTSLEGSVERHPRARRLSCTRCRSSRGMPRVYTVLKLDERRDREQTLDDKVESVRRHLREQRSGDYPPGGLMGLLRLLPWPSRARERSPGRHADVGRRPGSRRSPADPGSRTSPRSATSASSGSGRPDQAGRLTGKRAGQPGAAHGDEPAGPGRRASQRDPPDSARARNRRPQGRAGPGHGPSLQQAIFQTLSQHGVDINQMRAGPPSAGPRGSPPAAIRSVSSSGCRSCATRAR